MKESSGAFRFFGFLALVFAVFAGITPLFVAYEISIIPFIVISVVVFAGVGLLLIRKATRIRRRNRAAQESGISTNATVVQHERAFNIFSSTRYYVLVLQVDNENNQVLTRFKSSSCALFDKYPVGTTIPVLFHRASGAVVFQKD